MALTVRLSATTERAVDTLARRRRQTRSDVVREALEYYAEANRDGAAGRERPYEAWLDVIGVVRLGAVSPAAPGRHRTTGERFTAVVREKARARRTG